LSPEQKLSAFYRFTRQDVDISLQSAIVDTSFSTYHSIWDYNIYDSESYYSLSDIRAGSGTQEDFSHHAGLSFHWRFDEKTQLSMAGHLMVQDRRTQTTEQVLASRHNFWSWDHEWPDQIDSRSEVRATDEDKELSWDFETKQSSLRIPIFITRKFSDTIELLFGLNRSLLSWEITDVTLALFIFRKENHNGNLTKKEFFGERYTQPTERMSNVSTSVLFGLTVTPTSRFHIRFLMAPEFRNSYGETSLHQLNWWISFNVIQ